MCDSVRGITHEEDGKAKWDNIKDLMGIPIHDSWAGLICRRRVFFAALEFDSSWDGNTKVALVWCFCDITIL